MLAIRVILSCYTALRPNFFAISQMTDTTSVTENTYHINEVLFIYYFLGQKWQIHDILGGAQKIILLNSLSGY